MNFKKRTIADRCILPSESAVAIEEIVEEAEVEEKQAEVKEVEMVKEDAPVIEECSMEQVGEEFTPKRPAPSPPVKKKQTPVEQIPIEIEEEIEEDVEEEVGEEEVPSGQVTIDAEEYKRLRASQRLCGTDEELESWDWTSGLWLFGGLMALRFLKKN